MPRLPFLIAGALVLAAALHFGLAPSAAETARVIPPPAQDESAGEATTATIVLAGGCFWGVQGVYQHVQGVLGAVSGYAGGPRETASYDQVTSGRTGHAEAVRIVYDPRRVTLGQLLQIYFSVAHDPTQLNRQGPDVGTQYRSTIFPATYRQASLAKAYIDQLDQAKAFPAKIVTTIEPGQAFYPAEAYHQDYMTRHPRQPYIVMHDLPKVESLKRLFPAEWRSDPVLVSKTGM
ncbi:MAG: peptide-methionine (S)-S-oxide reductase MsrA [Reyranella sp.]|uniref:peptide-methionine (S)-S-oxide reductase MsrA n=1 Tax=Reyranella sp. TaxID=1929291 RepID=UPI003D0C680A